jgi:hypothetical protein
VPKPVVIYDRIKLAEQAKLQDAGGWDSPRPNANAEIHAKPQDFKPSRPMKDE